MRPVVTDQEKLSAGLALANEYAASIERKSTRYRSVMVAGLTVGLGVLVILAAVAGLALYRAGESQRAHDQARAQAISTQEQTIERISRECEDRSVHHADLVAEILTPGVRRRLGRELTADIASAINRAEPVRNCQTEVFNATGYDPTNPKTYPGGPMP